MSQRRSKRSQRRSKRSQRPANIRGSRLPGISKRRKNSIVNPFDTCIKIYDKKFLKRSSPPYYADKCMNRSRKGNDGNLWTSVSRSNNVYKWERRTNRPKSMKKKSTKRVSKRKRTKKISRKKMSRNIIIESQSALKKRFMKGPPYTDSQGRRIIEFRSSTNKRTYHVMNRKIMRQSKRSYSSGKCKLSNKKKYTSRPSPSYPAMSCKNTTKRGNDGKMWKSSARSDGIYRWVKK
uniref:Uncharacterized protein n=1 Tax=viral metagenome TaxID=1070528 RepID=A0A6C0JTM6_9ZZZZ